jgi:geranylgeranylglycerol-phosphate geranylgeranyltransferase
MSKIQAYILLGRPFTSLLGAVAIFAATFVGAGTHLGTFLLPAIIGAAVGYFFTSASDSLNDYFDRDADSINHPERAIPSGKISPHAALTFSMVLFSVSLVLGFFVGLLVGFQAFLVVLIAFFVEMAYDLKVKNRVKAFGNIFIGFLTVLAFVYGGVIVNNLSPVIFMAAASFLSITAREVVKDVEDIRGDSYKKSLPKMVGVRNANLIAITLILIAVILSIIAYIPLHIFGLGYFIAVLAADLLFLGSMPLLFKNPKAARQMWKFAMLIALLAFIVGGVI